MKKGLAGHLFRLVVFGAAVAITVGSCGRQKESEQQFAQMEKLTDEASLRQALDGEARLCAVLDAPVSGDVAEDPFGQILESALYIEYACSEYTVVERKDVDNVERNEYKWEREASKDRVAIGASLYLYEDIPIALDGCEGDKLQTNEELYYPNGDAEVIGALRYELNYLPEDANISFLAWVGDGTVQVYEAKNVAKRFYQDGEMADLSYTLQEGEIGTVIVVWLVAIVVLGVSFAVSSGPSKKKKQKQ